MREGTFHDPVNNRELTLRYDETQEAYWINDTPVERNPYWERIEKEEHNRDNVVFIEPDGDEVGTLHHIPRVAFEGFMSQGSTP